jgi:RecA-superfamily ATPases implicated in signal transduction
MSEGADIEQVSSGIAELDTLLHGGFVRGRTYLVQGVSGTGKSMLGQHFLEAGVRNDETAVYIHGEESKADILTNARQIGIDISETEFLDIGPGSDFFAEDISYDLVDTADVENERFTQDIKEVIENVNPERVLIDPITQLQYVERDEYQYRKRLQSLIRFLRDYQVTTVATRTVTSASGNETVYDDFESLSDGVVKLILDESERRISVPKHRGIGQIDGTHGLEIRQDGLEIYPQVLPTHTDREFDPSLLSTGDDAFDSLLGGGISGNAVTFLSGPTGVGKSTVGAAILDGIAEQGGRILAYLFEESVGQFTHRCESLGIPITELRDQGHLQLAEVEPLVQSGEEFGHQVVSDVETNDPEAVLIDGLAGYRTAIQGDGDRLVHRLHGLTRVLKNRGVATLITDQAEDITGVPKATSTNTSYIADTIIYLTYVELDGELARAIGVLKKRLGEFDNRFHRFRIADGHGLDIAGPFDQVHGIMEGTAFERSAQPGNQSPPDE